MSKDGTNGQGASDLAAPASPGAGWTKSRLALLAVFLYFAVIDVDLVVLLTRHQPLGFDFLPVWTATRLDPSRVYDFAYVTLRQDWRIEDGLRPFINPPTALLLLRWLGWLPFGLAYPVFTIGGIALFAFGARRLGAEWPLCLLPVPAVLAALVGQMTFLIGGLVMAALTLRDRPVLGGILLGLVGAIKPQMLVLLPVALLAERNWRMMIATGTTAALLILLTLPGGANWSDWLRALPQFQAYIADKGRFLSMSASPFAHFGAGSWLVTVPLAIAGAWLAFRQDDKALRLWALLGGALLIAPYALNYELTLLIPAILAYESKPRWSFAFWIVLLLNLSPVIVLGVAMLLLWQRLLRDPGVITWPRIGRSLPPASPVERTA